MKHCVIPTVFAHSPEEFKQRFSKLVKIASALQIDFMDGVLVPAMSMPLSIVPDLRKYKVAFEAHLMVADPEKWVLDIAKKGFRKIIVHIESIKNHDRGLDLIHRIRTASAKPMLAINPETSMEELGFFLNAIDEILVMGVHPGKEHQGLEPNTARRIITLKRMNPKLWVQVDGGVNADNIGELAAAGVDAVNSGSFIADAQNPKAVLQLLEKKFKESKG